MAINIGPTAYSSSVTNPYDWKDELSEYGKMIAYIKEYKDMGYSLYDLNERELSNIAHKMNLLNTGMHPEDPKTLAAKIKFHQRVVDHLYTLTEWQEEPAKEKMTLFNTITKINSLPMNAIIYGSKGVQSLWKKTNFVEWFKNKKTELKRKGLI